MSTDPTVVIEHPECYCIGDDVWIMAGVQILGSPGKATLGNGVTIYPNCFIQGSPAYFKVGDRVTFYPGNYISLGDLSGSFLEIGADSHFAPNGVLYGWGGLRLGRYVNVAAHVVFATVGHYDEITEIPMALSGEKTAPISKCA